MSSIKHTISILVYNNAGVLSRVSGLFSRRGFNIDSLAVGVTDNPLISRITIVAEGNDQIIEQLEKQLNKLIDVIKLRRLSSENIVSRELVLIKLYKAKLDPTFLDEVKTMPTAQLYDCTNEVAILEFCDKSVNVDKTISRLPKDAIAELVRTGVIALENENTAITAE